MVFKNLLSKNKDVDILANLPDGVLLVDSYGTVTWANDNAALIFNCDKVLLLKSDITSLLENGFDIIKQATEQPTVSKVKIESAKNTYLEVTVTFVQNSYVVALRDVTKNYKMLTNLLIEQKSSKKNNNDKNNFFVKLSNEFKAPIQSVVGFSQAMIDGLGGAMSEKQDKYVRIINKNSIDALYFINKIIELAKTEANLFEYESQIFDVVNTAQMVLKEYEIQAVERNLDWIFDSSEITKRSIFSDEGALKIILKNILEVCLNMTEVGAISVKLRNPEREIVKAQGLEIPENEEEYNEKSYLMIEIKDSGAGYSELEQEDLFEPYLQLDKPNKKNIVRSIVLATARNLVKHLKGSIWVESNLMQGCTYYVIIPVAR